MARQPAIFADSDVKEEAAPAKDKRTDEKVLEPYFVEGTGLYAVRYSNGGEVPDVLKGRYTNIRRAEEAIELHARGML